MAFETPDESIPVLVAQLIVGSISIIGNSIILFIVLRFKNFRSSICNCLMGLLAFSEIFCGIGILATAFYTLYNRLTGENFYHRLTCIAFALPAIFGVISGQLTMLSMALDRFLAVRKPLAYYKSNSKIRLYFATFISITFGSLYVWLATYNLDETPPKACSLGASATPAFIGACVIFSLIMAFLIFALYIGTVIILTKKSKVTDRNANHSLQIQRKVFVSISIILLCYAIFWCFPIFLGIIIVVTSANPILLGYMSLTIGLCSGINSCVGIFVYLAKHQELKEYFYKVFTIFQTNPTKGNVQMVLQWHQH